jgi:hypothetical protein
VTDYNVKSGISKCYEKVSFQCKIWNVKMSWEKKKINICSFCPLTCPFVRKSKLWCPLRFPHKTLLCSSIPPIVCMRVHALLCSLCLFVYSGVQHCVLLCVFMFVVECCVVRNDFRIKTTFGASLLRVVCRGTRVLYVLFALLHTTSALTARCSCIRDKNCLPFASTWVYPRFFGGVRVAYLLGFLCCVFFVCLFVLALCFLCLFVCLSLVFSLFVCLS